MRYQITGVAEYGYTLVLNPMMSNIEAHQEFGPFPNMAAVRAFYEGEKVEPYSDEGPNMFGPGTKNYSKSFRKGGPLEWLNPLFQPDWNKEEGFFEHHGHGVHLTILGVSQIQKQYRID